MPRAGRLLAIRLASLAIAAAAGGALLLQDSPSAHADTDGVEVRRAEAVSEFPEGIRFFLEAESESPIEDVRVWFRIVGTRTNQYNYLDLDEESTGVGELVNGEYFHRTNSRDRYSPPGTKLTYWFELFLENGETRDTEPAELIFTDARFEWQTAESGPVTVFYHGPVDVRAQSMADTALQTVQFMGRILGADQETPLRIIMYNNVGEMLGALAPRSTTISRELITEGQAFSERNVVLLLGSGRRAKGTVSHELTHVLVHRAASGSVLAIPLWLNEGLAEFGNVDQSLSYQRFLEWAVDTKRLTPFESLDVFPGDPNLSIVAYGQSRSVVEYMIARWGPEKMAELMATYGAGNSFDTVFERVYGLTVRELDSVWREVIGATPLEDAVATVVLPTAEPTSEALLPYTFGALADAGATPTSTAAPEPTETPEPSPTPEPEIVPAPEPTPAEQAPAGGGGCSAPARPGAPPEAASAAMLLIPIVGAALLALRRRRR